MKSMMKWAVVGAAAAALVASVAVAQGQGPGPQGRGGRGPGGMGGNGGPGGPGRAVLQGLSEGQRQQVKTIMDEGHDAQQGPPADTKLRRDLEVELLADTPNDQKIEDLKQQILLAQAEGLSRHISIQKRIAQILTAEQRARARERVAQAPSDGRGQRGGDGRRGGGGGGNPQGR